MTYDNSPPKYLTGVGPGAHGRLYDFEREERVRTYDVRMLSQSFRTTIISFIRIGDQAQFFIFHFWSSGIPSKHLDDTVRRHWTWVTILCKGKGI